jgi:hypothetical protein
MPRKTEKPAKPQETSKPEVELPHRITAADALFHGEFNELFSDNLSRLEACLQPATPLEEHLVRYIALSAWRIARMIGIERAVIMMQIEGADNELPIVSCTKAYKSLADNSRVLELMGRSETRAFRAFKDGLNLFFKIREQLPPAETSAKEIRK